MRNFFKLLIELFFLLLFSESLYAAPLGYGIFQKIHYDDRMNNPTKNIENPCLSGVEVIFNWTELEPENGKFRWELIDSAIEPWVKKDKQVILSFRTVQKKGTNPTQRSATPSWVYSSGVSKIEGDGTNWPIYWDKKFLEKYEEFIKSLAERYDGNPNIEFIIMGVGQFGGTKISGVKKILAEYKKNGYTEEVWSETIKKIINLYKKHFKKTPIALVLSPFHRYGDKSEEFIYPIAEYAAAQGVYLYNHSLTGNPDFVNNPFIPLYAKVNKITKIILGPDGPVYKKNLTEKSDKESQEESQSQKKKEKRRGGSRKGRGQIRDVIENSFGGVSKIPLTHVSYLIFYASDISTATKGSNIYDGTFALAIKEAYERLSPKNLEK